MPPESVTGFEGLLDLAKTPGGVLLLLVFLLQTYTMLSLVRKSKSDSGHTNGNGVAVAKDAMGMQQDYIAHLQDTTSKLFERDSRHDATIQAHTLTLQTIAQNEADRRLLLELNGAKMEQVSAGQADVRSDVDKLSQYNIRAVQSATAREIQFAKLVESVQSGQDEIIGLLQEIRDYLKPNGTEPAVPSYKHSLPTSADVPAPGSVPA